MRATAAIAVAWLALYAVLLAVRPVGGIAGMTVRDIAFDAVSFTVTIAFFARASSNAPARLPLVLLALAVACIAAGDISYDVIQLTHPARSVSFPSIADAVHLCFYPIAFAAFGLLVRTYARPGRAVTAVLDATIAGVTTFGVAWFVVDYAAPLSANATLAQRAVGIAYATGVMAVLPVAAMLVLRTRAGKLPSVRLLFSALIVIGAGDIVFAYESLRGTYHSGSALDLIWLTGYLLLLVAAMHPSVVKLGATQRGRPRPARAPLPRQLMVALACPVLALTSLAARDWTTSMALVGASAATVSLVVIRLAVAGRHNAEMAVEAQSRDTVLRRYIDALAAAHDARRRRLEEEAHAGPLQDISALGYRLDVASSDLDRGRIVEGTKELREARSTLANAAGDLRKLLGPTDADGQRVLLYLDDDADTRTAVRLVLDAHGLTVVATAPSSLLDAPGFVRNADILAIALRGRETIDTIERVYAEGFAGLIVLCVDEPDSSLAAAARGLGVEVAALEDPEALLATLHALLRPEVGALRQLDRPATP